MLAWVFEWGCCDGTVGCEPQWWSLPGVSFHAVCVHGAHDAVDCRAVYEWVDGAHHGVRAAIAELEFLADLVEVLIFQ